MSKNTKSLMVDTQRLVQAATEDGWGYAATRQLWALAGKPSDEWPGPDTLIELPAQWRYDDLAPKLDGRQRLAAVEALVDVDVRLIGSVLLAMARRIFLPYLPAGHAASRPTNALLDAFEGWVIGNQPAEAYVGEAFRYRSRFGATWSSAGTDEKYQYLFEAMPADGLCCALGERRWRLADHWRSFARFLASDRREWEVLDDMDERIDETVFVTDGSGHLDRRADFMATETAHQIVDSMREACIDAVQDEWDPELTKLLDELLPALRNLWFKTAGTA